MPVRWYGMNVAHGGGLPGGQRGAHGATASRPSCARVASLVRVAAATRREHGR
jgi:hypothetical protein